MTLHDKVIVAITGHKFCGKSTAGKVLINDFGFVRFRFADKLKSMLYKLGLSIEEVEGKHKEIPSEALMGKTPRQAMQTLGTDWGRNMIGNDIWVSAAMSSIRKSPVKVVVLDDCRFLNEAQAIKDVGGYVLRIVRPGFGGDDNHQSETEMDGIIVDHTIVSVGIEELRQEVRNWANGIDRITQYVKEVADEKERKEQARAKRHTEGGLIK